MEYYADKSGMQSNLCLEYKNYDGINSKIDKSRSCTAYKTKTSKSYLDVSGFNTIRSRSIDQYQFDFDGLSIKIIYRLTEYAISHPAVNHKFKNLLFFEHFSNATRKLLISGTNHSVVRWTLKLRDHSRFPRFKIATKPKHTWPRQ